MSVHIEWAEAASATPHVVRAGARVSPNSTARVEAGRYALTIGDDPMMVLQGTRQEIVEWVRRLVEGVTLALAVDQLGTQPPGTPGTGEDGVV